MILYKSSNWIKKPSTDVDACLLGPSVVLIVLIEHLCIVSMGRTVEQTSSASLKAQAGEGTDWGASSGQL